MKSFASVCVMLAALVPAYLCYPESYGGSSGYSAPSSYGGGGYGGSSYGGPKSSAADALKSFYNNQNGYNYNFGYDVKDYVYNNIQSRHESGDPKGQVTGSYSLVEPDGSLRTVNYVADWVNGFRATVSDKNGVTKHGYDSGSYGGDSGSYSGDSAKSYNGQSSSGKY